MSTERETELKTCLEAYSDPWLQQTLGKARAVRSVQVSSPSISLEKVTPYPPEAPRIA